MLLVHNKVIDEIDGRFLDVSRTEFNANLALGVARTKPRNYICTAPYELKKVINDARGACTTLFDPNCIRNREGAMESFGK